MQGHPDDWAMVLSEFERLQKPKTIIGYHILCKRDRNLLSGEVMQQLQDGWVLLGTPYVMTDINQDEHYHYQAIVKYE